MKKLLIALCFLTLFGVQAQEYDFVDSSLRLIPFQELVKKGFPSTMELVYFQDGTKTTFDEVLPYLSKGQLLPHMFVDSNGIYNTLVVYEPKPISFEALQPNTSYSFIPENLRALPEEELFRKPPPRDLDLVFYEDGTATSMNMVIPLIAKGELKPTMFVDENLKYTALVVAKK